MIHGNVRVPVPVNEPVRSYAPGSPERAEVKAALKKLTSEKLDIPVVIGGKEIRTGKTVQAFSPHDHDHVTADVHQATPAHVEAAIAVAMNAKKEWGNTPFPERAAIFLRAAELLATK